MKLEGKSVLITGGGRGIGAATTLLAAQEGARVGITSRTEAELDRTAARAAERGWKIRTYPGDVTDPASVEAVVGAFIKDFGGIDVLVNNAGMVDPKPMLDRTVEDWQASLSVNLIGVFLFAKAVAGPMKAQKSGKIVNVSSVRGIFHCGRDGIADYSAAKAGVISLTMTLAMELGPYVNVNAVAPSLTNTEIVKPVAEEIKRKMIDATVLKKIIQPEDVARAILFLASSDADMITGQVLAVDAGFSLKQA